MYEKLIKALRVEPFEVESVGLAKVMNEAADAIEELQKPRWISVEEKLPEVGKPVLCACRANIYEVMKMRTDGEWVHVDALYNGVYLSEFVTHWMLLPEPPKEEQT